MNVVLIDDDDTIREDIKNLLFKNANELKVIGEANSVKTGLALLKSCSPDILLLDVEMKDGSGFDLLASYGPPDFQIIFVTGYDHYAIKAFKYSAIDYLLKPIDPLELKSALAKAKCIQPSISIKNLIENLKREEKKYKILLKDNESIYLVDINDIIRCESNNNYTLFYLNDSRKLLICKTLKEYERLLDERIFFRTHQSHLINLNYFNRYEKKDGGTLILNDGTHIPLSLRKKESFLRRLETLQHYA